MGSQSQDTPSTLELMPDIEAEASESQDANNLWGTLFPEAEGFSKIALKGDQFEYTFGRKRNAHFCFHPDKWPYKAQEFQAISGIHFTLRYVGGSHGDYVELENHGPNGTYVNFRKIGKGDKHILCTKDVISAVRPMNKIFTFVGDAVDDSLPYELSLHYAIPIRPIGKGAMGEVRLAIRQGDAKCFAVKIIDKRKFSQSGQTLRVDQTEHVRKEIDILKHTDHPCIIKIFDVFQTDLKAFLILELADGGELFDRIVNSQNRRFDEATSKFYFIQLLHAIKYLHDNGIYHRDLKPENLLLSTKDPLTLLKVTDFGLAKHYDDQTNRATLCGTQQYMAPEVWSCRYTPKVDLWSAGAILYACLSGKPAFPGERPVEKIMKVVIDQDQAKVGDHVVERKIFWMPIVAAPIQTGRYDFDGVVWKNISDYARSMIRQLLVVELKRRMSAEEALSHPWIRKDSGMITKVNHVLHTSSERRIHPDSVVHSPQKKRPHLEVPDKEKEKFNVETDEEDETEGSIVDSSSSSIETFTSLGSIRSSV